MSSHREAPSNKSLTALPGIPTLADLETAGITALDELTHLDASNTNTIDWHTNLNITDLYVFRKPGDKHKTILIMNVNPMPPKLADAFDSTALYEFRIDTNGDAVADIAFRITFSDFEHGKQEATVRYATGTQAASDGNSGEIIIAHAPVSFDEHANVTEAGSYKFFAGIRSDPFFFDLMGFCNNSRFTGNDYFTDKEVFGIVLEVPNNALGEQSKVGIWSRVLWSHHEDWLQVARLGLPLVNILFNTSQQKDLFNHTEPDKQKALFLDSFVALLESLGHSAAQAQQIALIFLPDILQYDYSNEQGFFNGRKLTDDVVDSVLNLVTGGKVTTDMVGPHTDYLTTFPYLGQPHGR
ncbi:MAG TPA: DUF4331 family protein [Ktedonobacteraceae bacterium]|nr:DUF4331 family protein [Ktedonobacteraceae bacterium]